MVLATAGTAATTPHPTEDTTGADEPVYSEVPLVVPPVVAGEIEASDLAVPPSGSDEQAEGDAVLAADVAPASDRVITDPVAVSEYQTLGMTWPEGAEVDDLSPRLRIQEDGEWSAWRDVPIEDTAPDEGTPDAAAAGVRAGTESVWVGDSADAVQLSFAASAEGGPDGMSLVLVGSPLVESASAAVKPAGRAVVTTPLAAAASAPTVISRATWQARPQVCAPDVAAGLVGAVVHHTAGSNSYGSQAEAMQQIRNDQTYHIDGRGWCDLGYNFVVDKWGNIYEGRANSLTQPIIGVHAGGFNTGTVGVSMLGTYGSPPPAATTEAVGRIIGMRLAAYNIDPRGSFVYHTLGGENSKYPAGADVQLPRVFGHKDVANTACPGAGGWAAINQMREVAAGYVDPQRYAEAGSLVKALYQDLLGRAPDPVGYDGWRRFLMTGSQTSLVDSLTQSDEYIDKRVRQAYREVLGREPDPVGAAGWREAIKARRATVDAVQRTFYDSAEYFEISGGTPAGYVARLYETMLGRAASQADLAMWVDLYGSRGRSWVVDNIWWSAEAAQRRAGVYYQTFLGREPDLPGVQAWGRVLLAQGEGAVRIGIAGSDEYRQRAIQRFPS